MEFSQLSHDDIEKEAKQFLASFFADRDTPHVLPIPIESIAEHYLGYDIEISDDGIFANPLVLGGIIFDHKKIVINAATEAHEGRYSFTLAHEVGHHVLHKAAFEASESERMVCREDANKPLEERQADHFAGALLMPKSRVNEVFKVLGLSQRMYSALGLKVISRKIMTEGGFSNVSNQAMCVRLRQLGLIRETLPQAFYRKSLEILRLVRS